MEDNDYVFGNLDDISKDSIPSTDNQPISKPCKCKKPLAGNTTIVPFKNNDSKVWVNSNCTVCGGRISLVGNRNGLASVNDSVNDSVKDISEPKEEPVELSNKHKSLEIDARKEIARIDKAIGVARIAYPLANGEQRTTFQTKPKEYNGVTVSFNGGALIDTDLLVLYALIAIGQQQQPVMKLGSAIDGLLPKYQDRVPEENLAHDKSVAVINTSYSAINKLLGKTDGGENNKRIKESLKWLSGITVFIEKGRDWGVTHLISAVKGGDTSVSVALSYRLTEVLLGVDGAFYGACNVKQLASLKTSVAKITYSFFVNWFSLRHKNLIGIDALVEHVWNKEIGKLTAETLKKRRSQIREGLKEINKRTNFVTSQENKNRVVQLSLVKGIE